MRKGVGTSAVLFMFLFAVVDFPCAQEVNAKRVLLIAREKSEDMHFMLVHEVRPMMAALQDAGYKVDVADESGNPIVAGDQTLDCDMKLSDAQIAGYAGILVPCMSCETMPHHDPPDAVRLLKEAYEANTPIAAQHAMELVRPMGLPTTIHTASSAGVIRDGNLITSFNCPMRAAGTSKLDETLRLVATFIDAMEGHRD